MGSETRRNVEKAEMPAVIGPKGFRARKANWNRVLGDAGYNQARDLRTCQ